MKNARTRLLKDLPVIGEGPPMASSSEQAIKTGDVLYTLETSLRSCDYDDDDEDEIGDDITITAHRVIQLNYQDRYLRMRCGNGCEQSIHFGEGCSKTRVWHDLAQVRAEIEKRIETQYKAELETFEKLERDFKKRKAALTALKTAAQRIDVHVPQLIEA